MPYLIHNAIALELLENSSNTFIHFLLSPVQTDATLLDVTCYVRLHTLFHVVGCCCVLLREVWNRSNFSANNSQYFLFRDHRNVTQHTAAPFAQLFQHCWSHARSLRMVYKDLWVVSFPRCTTGPNTVGSCCVRLHAAFGPSKIPFKFFFFFLLLKYFLKFDNCIEWVDCWTFF